MTAGKTPHLDTRIAVVRGLLALSVSASTALAAPVPETAAEDETQVRTVSEAAQPCLNLRESPTYTAQIVGCIGVGTELVISGTQNGWSRVSSQGEGDGWVGTRLLGPAAASPPTAPRRTGAQASGGQAGDGQARPGRGAAAGGRGTATSARTSERLIAERDALATQLADANARITTLEEELTRMTFANDELLSQEMSQSERDQLESQLAESEERASELEAELASTRAAWGSSAKEGETLSRRIAELTAERDSLANDLAEAEARQIYLQSGLETTRAELMQLKGIPPELVAPESEPVVVTLPAPEPEPAAVEESADRDSGAEADTDLGSDLSRTEEVSAATRAWAQAWSSQQVDDYLSFYAPRFQPADGLDRTSWASTRRARVSAPRAIEVTLDKISPTVSGTRAIVLFEQTYSSDQFTDVVSKTLVLDLIDGLWLIVQERVND